MVDQTILWGLGALLLLTPLAVGGVEPWAYAPMEALVFSLTALWLARGVADPGASAALSGLRGLGAALIPAALLIGLAALQLAPIPPGLLRAISPASFELYQNSLPGWPAAPLNVRAANGRGGSGEPAAMVALPTVDEAAAGEPVPFRESPRGDDVSRESPQPETDNAIKVWRTLSLAPSLTFPALLKLICYAGFFLLVAAYPFDDPSGSEIGQRLARIIVLAGFAAAMVALGERIYSNGRALWLFQPYDWPKGDPWGARAVGSFANPDHLANFLDQALPFAAVGALWPAALARKRRRATRILAVAAVISIASALLLSSSRGGWVGALSALAVLAALRPQRAGVTGSRTTASAAAAVGFGLALILLLLFVGPHGRSQVDARLKETVTDESLAGRQAPAKASLSIIKNFPVFGVGLGCWPEIFPRYAPPPWTPTFWNATHNDYAQLASETGLVGFALAAWFGVAIGRRIRVQVSKLKPGGGLLVAAATAGVAAAAVHEFFDFPLQIPANAMLCTALLGLAVRLTSVRKGAAEIQQSTTSRLLYGLGFVAALGLILAALTQSTIPYPYSLKQPRTIGEAYALINAHPANAKAHLALAELLSNGGSGASRDEELRAAVWLAPTNPFFRDLYARALLERTETTRALREITKSVSYSPDLDTHFYLKRRLVPWLPAATRQAIQQGFAFAVSQRYPGAVDDFASYYDALRDLPDEAAVFEEGARQETSLPRRAYYFERAGTVYVNAGRPAAAAGALHSAIAIDPANPEPYTRLIFGVIAPAKNWDAANTLIEQAIGQGSDPVQLYLALAAGAQTAGDYEVAHAALQKALAARPANYDALMQMGLLEMATNHPDRAANWLRRASHLQPTSVEAFSALGRAEENAYEYIAADRAYRRAAALAPDNAALKEQYANFRTRVAQNSNPNQ